MHVFYSSEIVSYFGWPFKTQVLCNQFQNVQYWMDRIAITTIVEESSAVVGVAICDENHQF